MGECVQCPFYFPVLVKAENKNVAFPPCLSSDRGKSTLLFNFAVIKREIILKLIGSMLPY